MKIKITYYRIAEDRIDDPRIKNTVPQLRELEIVTDDQVLIMSKLRDYTSFGNLTLRKLTFSPSTRTTFFEKPSIKVSSPLVFDGLLSDDQLWEKLAQMAHESDVAERELNVAMIAYDLAREKMLEEVELKKLERTKKLELETEAARQAELAKAQLTWTENSFGDKTAICDLAEAIRIVADATRRSSKPWIQDWVKEITGVDESRSDGFMYLGTFVKAGTIRIGFQPTLFLVKSTEGSRNHLISTYSLVVLGQDGQLHQAEGNPMTDNEQSGWALRMLSPIKDELKKLGK